MPLYDFRCKKCGKLKELIFRMNDEKKAECCGKPMLRLYGSQVNADLLYQFTAHNLGKKPVEIHSRTQWKRELKSRGLTDNFDNLKTCFKTDKQRVEESRPKFRRMAEEAYRKAKGKITI